MCAIIYSCERISHGYRSGRRNQTVTLCHITADQSVDTNMYSKPLKGSKSETYFAELTMNFMWLLRWCDVPTTHTECSDRGL